MPYVFRDSGVFLYTGWRILNGELPYRDVWDHKPPLILYINALGLAIADGSRWGVWLIELFCLSFAAFAAYRILSKAFGTLTAIPGTLLWLLTLAFVIEGGNLTTEYTLPLQFSALWLATITLGKPTCQHWHWFLIGLTGGVAFFCKQTTIGLWISVVLFLIMYRARMGKIKQLAHELSCFSGGVAAVCAAWTAFFVMRNGFHQFWNSAFEYNFFYSTTLTAFRDRLNPVLIGITPLTTAGLLQFAGIGCILTLLMIRYKRDAIRDFLPLMAICLIDFPIELALISTSGWTYAHYYMTILPVLAVFSAVAFWSILSSRQIADMPNSAKYVLSLGICGVFIWSSFNPYKKQVQHFGKSLDEIDSVVGMIEKNTNADDKVLLWGAEPSVNFFARRKSPTRFVYQYPLYSKGYANENNIEEFLDDLLHERPKFIIDTCNSTTPLYEFPVKSAGITERIHLLKSRYRIADNVRDWTVYEYKSDDSSP